MFSEIFEDHFESRLIAPEASLIHSLWVMARGNRAMPEESEIPTMRLAYLRDDLMILRPLGPSEWLYEHYGRRILQSSGFDMTGRRVSEFQGPLKAFFTDVYTRVCREKRPLATIHRMGGFAERPLWERLILPFGKGDVVTGLYVVNKVREREKDISHLFARARGRGLFILEFLRDAEGVPFDARIIGANQLARDMTHLRHDQLTTSTMLSIFPHLRQVGVWDHYKEVGASREAKEITVDYHAEGIDGRFVVHIAPYLDGVSVDFTQIEDGSDLSSSAA